MTTTHTPSRPAGTDRIHDADSWLTGRRNDGATPPEITAELVASGWPADTAAAAALRSMRAEDRQDLLWFALCWSSGLAAVGVTTGVHQLLADSPDRPLAAEALTLAIVMAPIAVLCGWLARRAEARSPFAVWSPARRSWFGTLAAATAGVGLVRLVTYLYQVVSSVVGGEWSTPLSGRDLAQVLVSLSVSIPLFTWSFLEWRRSNVAISALSRDAS